jgi:cardiolipin synthase
MTYKEELNGMVFLWSSSLILVLILLFALANHYRLQKHYQKKQSVDQRLFNKVLLNLDDPISTNEARKQFDLKRHGDLLASIKSTTQSPLTQNDRVEILKNGEETYTTLFKAINEAQHHIHVLYYTIQDDRIGKELLQHLMKKSREGVEVRVVVDGVGSQSLLKAKNLLQQLNEVGIHFSVFSPPRLGFLLNINFRNHRKIVVIDGKIGFTGGLNVGDEYLHKDPLRGYWRDIHLLIEGEAVLLLQKIFAMDWYYVTNHKLTENDDYFPQFSRKETHQNSTTSALAQVVPSGPDMHKNVVRDVYRDMIRAASERVWLATPYFVPDQAILMAMKEAAINGVDVRLLVPHITDNRLVQAASFHFYHPLLKAGVKIYRYNKGFYHAKIALIDTEVCKIGSANLDQRSFNYSFEAGVFLFHKETCSTIEEIFNLDFLDCTLLETSHLDTRTLLQRTATQISLLFAPWL